MSTAHKRARALEGKSANAKWLVRYLGAHGGRVPESRVFAAGEARGMSRRTVLRAARELGADRETVARLDHFMEPLVCGTVAVFTVPHPFRQIIGTGPYYLQWADPGTWVDDLPSVGCPRCEAGSAHSGPLFGLRDRDRPYDDRIYFLPDGRVIPCACGNGAPLRIACNRCEDGRITVHACNAIEACWDCSTGTPKDYAHVRASDPWEIGLEFGPGQIPPQVPWRSWPKRWPLQTCHTCEVEDTFLYAPRHSRECAENPQRRYCLDCLQMTPRRTPDASLAAALAEFIDERELIGDPEEMRLDWIEHCRGAWRRGEADEWTPAGNLPAFTAAARLAVVTKFVGECLTFGEGVGSMTKVELFERWSAWADAEGYPPGSPVAFGRTLRVACPKLRPMQMGKARTWAWRGVTMRADVGVVAETSPEVAEEVKA